MVVHPSNQKGEGEGEEGEQGVNVAPLVELASMHKTLSLIPSTK